MQYGKTVVEVERSPIVVRGQILGSATRTETPSATRPDIRSAATEEPPAWEVDPFYFG